MKPQSQTIKPNEPAYFFVICSDRVMQSKTQPGPLVTSWSELDFLHHYQDSVVSLGEQDNRPCWLVDMGREELEHDHFETVSLRGFMLNAPQLFGIVARAWQYALFLRTHKYCGQCGFEMHHVEWEMAMSCNRCQHRCYPRISPCIIVAVRRDNEILLAHGRHHKNEMYSTLAGFVESGEELEQAVHREVKEEVGINIKNIEYFGSQPWPFPHSLMCGFLAEWDSGEIEVDGHEIVKADWFSPNQLPNIPPVFSIAGRLIEETLQRIQSSDE